MASINTTTDIKDLESIFKEGYAPFEYDNIPDLKTYYTIAGDLKNSKETPILLAAGGPGLNCQYLVTHGDLAIQHGVPVILYDQLGVGNSTHLPEKDCEFWTLELFAEQIQQLVVHLGIQDRYNLLGHAWSGTLCSYFAGTRKPSGLQRLILISTSPSMPLANECIDKRVEEFPERLRIAIEKAWKGEDYSEEDMTEANRLWVTRHFCAVDPMPEPLVKTFMAYQSDKRLNVCMRGTVPFKMGGTVENISVIDKLPNIAVPTLLLNGEFDMALDLCVQPLFDCIPKVKWVKFAQSSNTPFFEERERYMTLLYDFIKS